MEDNKNFNYMTVNVTAKDLPLIIDQLATYFKAYKIHGNSSNIYSSAKISGYITEFSFKMLCEKADTFATVKITVEEFIKC